ncbi:glycerate kinase [Mumia flava]|uniref:Glycerate kinase n=1 Tax=Mumia flava TaxID=1348852 RepID=A0A2M9BDN9_9ACTN|nr:glycerate kinase [Mumia flava]PJJ56080.1 glycerate kinase [Mumia flava]
MRVLVAPDKFAGTLSAPEAAAAIAAGWARRAPDDVLDLVGMADGGPGFVTTLHAALGGRVQRASVRGPLGAPVDVEILLVDHGAGGAAPDGPTAYVESAQACGLAADDRREPDRASTYGVGQAVATALDAGARTVVVGLGGSATTDGGAGLLAALGAEADRPLDGGPQAFDGIGRLDLAPARSRVAGVRLVAATDVTTPLLGMFGAARTFGPQKGLDSDGVLRVDGLLEQLVVAACGSSPAERRAADAAGAGAAGGLGFALQLLGAATEPGVELVADAVGLTERARSADVVITGEGSFDITSAAGKVVDGVADRAAAALRPCVVLAGRVEVGSRERRAMGIEAAYALVDLVGAERAMAEPAAALAELGERVATTWSSTGRRDTGSVGPTA